MGLPKETLSFDELCDMAEVVSGIMDISVLQHVLLAEAKKGKVSQAVFKRVLK